MYSGFLTTANECSFCNLAMKIQLSSDAANFLSAHPEYILEKRELVHDVSVSIASDLHLLHY